MKMRDYMEVTENDVPLDPQSLLDAKKKELAKATEFKCRFAELTTFSNCPKAPVKLDFGPKYQRTGKRAAEKRPSGRPSEEKKRDEAFHYGASPEASAPLRALQ